MELFLPCNFWNFWDFWTTINNTGKTHKKKETVVVWSYQMLGWLARMRHPSVLCIVSTEARIVVWAEVYVQNQPCIINIEFVNVETIIEIDISYSFEHRIAQLQIIL